MSNLNDISFEAALTELEDIVKSLEKGDCTLDNSVKLFERGIELSKYCYDKIDVAKLKVEKLSLATEENLANE